MGNRVSRRRGTLALGLGLLLVAMAAFPTTRASAASYEVKLCAEGSGGDGIQLVTISPSEIANVERCTRVVNTGFVEGISEQVEGTSGSSAFGDVGWKLHAPAGTKILTLKATRESSEFWDPEMVWFTTNGSKALEEIKSSTSPHLKFVEYPVNSELFSATLSCVVGHAPGCVLGKTLGHSFVGLTNMVVTFEDKAAPTIAFGSPPSKAFGTVDVPFTASDSGGGVQRVEVFVDGKRKETIEDTNGGRCATPFIFVVPCKLQFSTSYSLDTTGLKAPVDDAHVIRVVATDAAGQTGEGSETIQVHNAPVNSRRPQVGGQAMVGSTLTALPGEWEGATPVFSFQWLRCDPGVTPGQETGCVEIEGETGASYVPNAVDVGRRDAVRVTARSAFGSQAVVSDPSEPVADLPPGAPQLQQISLQPRRFRRGVPRAHGKRRGAFLSYFASEPGTLKMSVSRLKKGAPKRIGAFTRPARPGDQRLVFTGRVGRRSLRPGRYQITVTLVDASGAASNPVTLAFTILPG